MRDVIVYIERKIRNIRYERAKRPGRVDNLKRMNKIMKAINKNTQKKQRALTQSQETYVQELIKGTPRFEAYQKAYPSSLNWKKDSVDQAAYSELNKVHVKARYDELKRKVDAQVQTQIIKKRVWTTEKAIDKLEKLAEKAEELIEADGKISMTKVQAILGAVKELNSMHGYNEKNINSTNKVVIVGSEDDLED